MGINIDILKHFNYTVAISGQPFPKTMCELGNQRTRGNLKKWVTGKRLFEHLGYQHTSLDINGKDGAAKRDLSVPIVQWKDGKRWLCQFDIVTSFGTLEHVANQLIGYQNFNNLARPGGILILAVPVFWPWHGVNRNRDWLDELARINGYQFLGELAYTRIVKNAAYS